MAAKEMVRSLVIASRGRGGEAKTTHAHDTNTTTRPQGVGRTEPRRGEARRGDRGVATTAHAHAPAPGASVVFFNPRHLRQTKGRSVGG